ncbi:unnamed protein product [Phaeothamnion confervicola]
MPPRAKEEGGRDALHILILTADTGGGHRAAACGVRDGLVARFGTAALRISTVDIWTEVAPFPFNTLVAQYRFMSKHPLVWWLFYHFTAVMLVFLDLWSTWVCAEHFRRFFKKMRPDLVISVHPMCQHLPLRVLKELGGGSGRAVPFATVVTDLGHCHPVWFHEDCDALFAPRCAF